MPKRSTWVETKNNHQIRDVAEMVQAAVPGSAIEFGDRRWSGRPVLSRGLVEDRPRLPEFTPAWNVAQGIQQLCEAFRKIGLSFEDLEGPSFLRMPHVLDDRRNGRLNESLRW